VARAFVGSSFLLFLKRFAGFLSVLRFFLLFMRIFLPLTFYRWPETPEARFLQAVNEKSDTLQFPDSGLVAGNFFALRKPFFAFFVAFFLVSMSFPLLSLRYPGTARAMREHAQCQYRVVLVPNACPLDY
jgi:hypothetical protein